MIDRGERRASGEAAVQELGLLERTESGQAMPWRSKSSDWNAAASKPTKCATTPVTRADGSGSVRTFMRKQGATSSRRVM